MGVLVENHVRRQYGVALDSHVTGYGDAVAQHTVAFDVGIMAYMAVGKDKVAVAYHSALGRGESAVDDHMLADGVVVTYGEMRLPAFPSEVLGLGAYYGSLIHFVVLAHHGAFEHTCIGFDFTAVAYHDIFVDVSEGMDCHVFADAC